MAIIPTAKIFSENEWVEFINYLAVSSRQAEVIKRLLSGLADKQIALEIQISVAGVLTHLSQPFHKV